MKILLITFSIFLILLGSASSQIPTTGLVAYYPFNGNPNDLSGNGNNGTVIGGVSWASDRNGIPNTAARFNGFDASISVINSSTLQIHGDITIAAWVQCESPQDNRFIIEKYYGGSIYNHGWLLATYGVLDYPAYAAQALFQGRDGTTTGNTIMSGPSGNFADGRWHFLVGMRSGTNWMIYKDGVLTNHYDSGTTGSIEDGGNIRIGGTNVEAYHWNGLIDDIRIYNRSLSNSEMQELYHESGWQQSNGDLVAYYPFNGNANDESGNGNDGTVDGATLTTNRFEQPNTAYYFNGSTNSIRVLNSASLNPTDITVCAWAYYQGASYNGHVVSKGLDQYDLFIEKSIDDGIGGNINNQPIRSQVPMPRNVWTFLCLVKNPDSVYLYMNGTMIRSAANTGNIIPTSNNLFIGRHPSDANSKFEGKLDDIRIYGHAMSSREIDSLFHEGGFANCEKPALSGIPAADGGTFQCLGEVPAPPTITASDCHGVVRVIYSQSETNPGSSCNNSITRTWSATNQYGTTTFTQLIHVNDTMVPLITCPNNVNVSLPPGGCAKKVTFQALASDGCNSAPSVTYDHAPGTDFGPGTTTVTVKAIDACGNTDSCKFTVTVVDNEPPTIACPGDVTIAGNIFGQCGAALTPGTPSAGDNCSVSVVGVRSDAKPLSDPYPLGITTILWTATDALTNQASCIQKITVTNPAPDVSITSPPSGALYAVGSTVNFTGSYTDNAGGAHTATWMADANSFAGTVNEAAQTVTGSYTFTVAGVY